MEWGEGALRGCTTTKKTPFLVLQVYVGGYLGPQKRTIFSEYVTRRVAEKHLFMCQNQISAWTSSRTSAWPTQCGKGPSLGCFLIQVKKRHHRHRDEIIFSPVVDWPYRLAYVNASIEDMAPTHRQQYLMVKSMKRHKDM